MIYIGIGSNLGNRLKNLQMAVALMKERCFSEAVCSIVLETEAILPTNAPEEWNRPFLNMILAGKSKLTPEKLLKELKNIETEMGRPKDHAKWSPRIIDLDILIYHNEVIETSNLNIPHQQLLHRPFLLHLIALLNPLLIYPGGNGITFNKLAMTQPGIEKCFTNTFIIEPKLVGVVNITPDSFSDGGLYLKPEMALNQIKQLLEEGASIVEIGAQSTRPGAQTLTAQEELCRLEPILDGLFAQSQKSEFCLSLDSFWPETILKALKRYPIAWINDVKGALDTKTLKKIAEQSCSLCAMHSLTVPPSQNFLPLNASPNKLIGDWGKKIVKNLKNCGFSENKIILDPGIGFGKSRYQNLLLLKEISELQDLGCKTLIGHSRKSYITSFYAGNPQERDLETIAISQWLKDIKVDYLRVHNVKDHQRSFVAQQVIKTIGAL